MNYMVTVPPLDESLYKLDDEQSAFFKALTGIQDDEELKRHIISVQKKAYAVGDICGYPCIKRFTFTELKISRLPAYPKVLDLIQKHENGMLLDIGCCFGNDVRKTAYDGWPTQNIVASDLVPEFWDYGHELFRSTSETFAVKFIAGDALDSEMILPREPFHGLPSTQRPEISTLKSLSPLQGTVSVIHASAFFHLFDEDKQLYLARRLASLLSPLPGSIILGSHMARPIKGYRMDNMKWRRPIFCHSKDSWKEMWDGVVFKKGTVRVEASLSQMDRPELPTGPENFYLMTWSVTRV